MRQIFLLILIVVASSLPHVIAQDHCSSSVDANNMHALLTDVEGHVPRQVEVGRTQAASDLLLMLQDEGSREDVMSMAAGVYGVEPLSSGGNVETREAALQTWLTSIAARVGAHGVLLRDAQTGAIIAAGTYSISPLYERLRGVRLDPSLAYADRDVILRQLDTCFVKVDTWIEIPTTVVEELLRDHDDAYIYAAITTIDGEDEARWIQARRLVDVVTFNHTATRDATTFSAWFVGAGVSPLRLARLLPEIRSNATPGRLLDLVSSIVR